MKERFIYGVGSPRETVTKWREQKNQWEQFFSNEVIHLSIPAQLIISWAEFNRATKNLFSVIQRCKPVPGLSLQILEKEIEEFRQGLGKYLVKEGKKPETDNLASLMRALTLLVEDSQYRNTKDSTDKHLKDKSFKKRKFLLVDFDKTLSGMNALSQTIWIEPTLARIKSEAEKGAETIIFTSMDSSILKQDVYENTQFKELKKATALDTTSLELVTRAAGVAKLESLLGGADAFVRVMTPHDALANYPIGQSYETLHKPTYKKFLTHFNEETYKINLSELEKDKDYNQFLLDELYLTRVDSIINMLLKDKGGNISSYTANSFEPLKHLIRAYAPESSDKFIKQIEDITANIQSKNYEAAKSALIVLDELAKKEIKEPKINHIIELMLIQSMIAVSEIRSHFEAFLEENASRFNYIKVSQALYKFTKDASQLKLQHTEKFLMSLHTLKELTKDAQPGDVISIEYLDDKEECLNEMLGAQNYFVKKLCDKNITIHLKTTIVKSISAGNYELKPYKETIVANSAQNRKNRAYSQAVTKIYQANLEDIRNRIDKHTYDLAGGGKKIGDKRYSHSAFEIRNIITKVLGEGKPISHQQYSRIAYNIELILCGKLRENKGSWFFGLGSRKDSTANLYKDILKSLVSIPNIPQKKVEAKEEINYKSAFTIIRRQ
ncbi:hypothetical protein [Legionella gresilensis]|uniref:hypothetical protein n=1 Tax=Legionella gresilensis TaxID=91823 RepID=UPI001040F953|nr:hypothetical protein [Legionella gresilensis]